MIQKIWLLAFFCLSFLTAQAQIGKFLKLETFEQDADFWLQKHSDTITTEIAPDFKTTYQNLSEKQRDRVFRLSSEMFKRGLSPVPHVSSFWACLVYGVKKKNFSADQIDNFLDVAEKTAEGCKFRLDLLSKFLYTSRLFLRDGFIYRSRFNQLIPNQNVSFKFGHVFFDNIAPAPLPSQQEVAAEPAPIQEVSPSENNNQADGWGDENWAATDNQANLPVISAADSLAILKAKEEQPISVSMPQASGPYIVFEKTDLLMASIYDSMLIKDTQGSLLLFEDEWVGKEGKVTWQNVKLSPEQVFANLLDYSFDVRSPKMIAQNAKLTYTSKIQKPVLGVYEYQSNRGNSKKNANFPRFMSYDSRAKIDNVLPDVNFIGGFSLVGKNISSKNISGNPSIIEVKKGGILKFRATTFKDYIFTDSSVIGQQASVSVFFNEGKDSIYHLGIQLLYDAKKSILNARKDKEYNRSPFTNSYQKVDITADHLKWELSKNVIDISIKSAYLQVPAIVESLDYFDKDRFSQLQGMSRYHPLMAAVNYGKKNNLINFKALELAKFLFSQDKTRPLNSWHSSLKQFMLEMHRYGYLKFNQKTDEITLLKKGVLYASAILNKADFDKIQIASQVELDTAKKPLANKDSSNTSQADSLLAKKQILKFAERNIILDLTNNDLIINGVTIFPVRLRDEDIKDDTKYMLSKRSIDELKDEMPADLLNKLQGFVKNKNQFKKDKDFFKVLVDSLGEETALAHKDKIFYAARPDILDIYVIPIDKKIVMKKNRDFYYDGMLYANGFAHFYGKNFMFKYDSFKIDMPTIDSLAYIVKNDTTGKLEPMSNKILGASGTLLIANPKNKSGLREDIIKDLKKYPIMNFTKGGDIAFSDTKILDGENVYADTSKFKFNAKPYAMTDISRHDPKNLKLEGELKTSIFPTLDEPMQVRSDGSFGFVHQILPDHQYPDGRKFPKGLPMYEDSSKTQERTAFYNGEIRMDNKGMRGTGIIKYLNAELESNDFVFYPDSVTALSKHVADTLKSNSKGKIKAGMMDGISYPDVAMENLKLQWMVRKDSMVLSTTKKAFDLYHIPSAVIQKDQKSTFTGSLILAPSLVGRGIFENAGSKITSQRFAFEQNIFTAKEAKMEIKSEDGEPAVLAENITLEYDMETRKAVASSPTAAQSKSQSISFPYTKYTTTIAKAVWDFDKKNVEMSAEGGKDKKNSFTSNRADQDSLTFEAGGAIYDLKDYTLNISEVNYIFSVDSRIYPDSGKVVVRKSAEMDTLRNSKILVNEITQYHNFDKGRLKIHSRKKYKGNARYIYKNDIKQEFDIKFTNFFPHEKMTSATKDSIPKTTLLSYSRAMIKESDNFIKQAGVQYRGEVEMRADTLPLFFRGQIKLTDDPKNPWTQLDTITQVLAIQAIEEDSEGRKLGTGLFLNRKNNRLYTATRTLLENDDDQPLFGANGAFRQDPTLNRNIVETVGRGVQMGAKEQPKARVAQNYQGSKFSYSKQDGKVEYDGLLSFFPENKDFNIKFAGFGKGDFKKSDYEIEGILAIDMPNLKSNAMDIMKKDIAIEKGTGESVVNYNNPDEDQPLLYNLASVLPSDLWLNKYYPNFKDKDDDLFPKVFRKSLVLSDLKLKWSADLRSFYSVGRIGFANLFDEDINIRLVESAVEIIVGNDPELTMYLQFDDERWYMINYKDKKVRVLGSNAEFNADVQKSKDKFKLLEESEKADFLRRFRDYHSE